MSVLRRAVESRSIAGDLAGAFPGDATGTTGWQQGMVWNGYGTTSGTVTVDSSMRLSAVFACLRLISEAISTLPLDVFRRVEGIRLPAEKPGYLTFEVPQTSRINYLSQVMLSLLTDGNAFVATPRNGAGVPVDLIPLDPAMVKVERQTSERTQAKPFRKGEIFYTVAGNHYDATDIMHIPGMMLPGALRGVSPIRAARDVIDGGASAQEFGRTFNSNMAVPPAVIEMPPMEGNDSQAEMARARRMAETWRDTHGGSSNAGKVGVLTGGAKLSTVAVTPADAQWLESKKFGISEIARFYGAPPHLIADASNSTSWGSGLAEQNTAFGQFTLRTWTERIDDSHTRLLSTHGEPASFVKLNLDAGLRASTQARYDAHRTGIEAGFLQVDEVRAMEDLQPLAVDASGVVPDARALAESLQKIYLAVGKVISAEEAREILNRDGAGLTGPAPQPAPGGAP